MTTVNVTLNLPDEVAKRAREAGLLEPHAIEVWLQRELQLKAAEAGSWMARHLRRLEERNDTPMSMEEINAEIRAYRAEKRAADARGA